MTAGPELNKQSEIPLTLTLSLQGRGNTHSFEKMANEPKPADFSSPQKENKKAVLALENTKKDTHFQVSPYPNSSEPEPAVPQDSPTETPSKPQSKTPIKLNNKFQRLPTPEPLVIFTKNIHNVFGKG